jgi:hypothetical protein
LLQLRHRKVECNPTHPGRGVRERPRHPSLPARRVQGSGRERKADRPRGDRRDPCDSRWRPHAPEAGPDRGDHRAAHHPARRGLARDGTAARRDAVADRGDHGRMARHESSGRHMTKRQRSPSRATRHDRMGITIRRAAARGRPPARRAIGMPREVVAGEGGGSLLCPPNAFLTHARLHRPSLAPRGRQPCRAAR